jgi:hypothetical protein
VVVEALAILRDRHTYSLGVDDALKWALHGFDRSDLLDALDIAYGGTVLFVLPSDSRICAFSKYPVLARHFRRTQPQTGVCADQEPEQDRFSPVPFSQLPPPGRAKASRG